MKPTPTQPHDLKLQPQSDSKDNWVAVFAIATAVFAMVATEFLPIGLITRIAKDLDVSEGKAGLVVTIPGVAAAIAAPILLLLVRTTNRKSILLGLAILVILSNIVSACAGSLTMLLFGRLLLGIAIGGVWAFSLPVGRRLVMESRGNRAISIITAGIAIGTVVGLPAGSFAGEIWGWRKAFGGAGIFAIIILIFQSLTLPSLPAQRTIRWGDIVGYLNVRSSQSILFIAFLFVMAHFAAYTYMEPFLRQESRLDTNAVSLLLLIYGIAGFIGSFVGEYFVHRWGAQRSFVFLFFVMASLAAAILSGSFTAPLTIAISIWGLIFAAMPVCINAWIFQASPKLIEAGSTALVSTFQFAIAMGAFVGGVVVDHSNPASAFRLSSFLFFVTGLIVMWQLRSKASCRSA